MAPFTEPLPSSAAAKVLAYLRANGPATEQRIAAETGMTQRQAHNALHQRNGLRKRMLVGRDGSEPRYMPNGRVIRPAARWRAVHKQTMEAS